MESAVIDQNTRIKWEITVSENLYDYVQFFIICTHFLCDHELQQSFYLRRASNAILDVSGMPLRVSSTNIGSC